MTHLTSRLGVRRPARALAVAALGTSLVAGLVVGSAAPGSAAPTRAERSAGWLAGQLSDQGLMYNPNFGGFNDYGLTADTAYALDDLGVREPAQQRIREGLAANVDDWTTFNGDVYSGSTAKALVVAQVTGARPRDFGGVDLVARLEDRVATTAPIRGRLEDKTTGTDFANTIGQAFAARGLSRIGSDLAGPVTSYLRKQQCTEGFFRLSFPAKDAPRQDCDADSTPTPSVDATALAVLGLQSIADPTAAEQTSITKGLRWLVREQRRAGAFSENAAGAPNANSTGLAAWALGQGGRCAAAQDAARWINEGVLRNGAISYDRAAYRTAQEEGITRTTRDQFRRATSQAAPGLAYLNLAACQG